MSNTKNNIFIHECACVRRRLDAKKFSNYFNKNNYKIVDDPDKADFIILFTCGSTEEATVYSMKLIKKFQKYDAELIVAGCLPDVEPDRLKQIFNGKTVATKNMEKIDEIFKDNKTKFNNIEDVNSPWKNYGFIGFINRPFWILLNIFLQFKIFNKIYQIIMDNYLRKSLFFQFTFRLTDNKENFFIHISRGCIHNCSYCSIRRAIGPLISKPLDKCLNEFKTGLNKGYKHFFLVSDDVGAYGLDIKSNLYELLDEMTKIEGNFIISLEEIHPNWIIKYIDDLEKIIKRRKIKHLLVAIQSGNDRILKLMKRSYGKEALINSVSRLKKAYPGLVLGTHAIIGFPSETKAEFEETLNLIKHLQIQVGFLPIFSNMKGAKAEYINPKITSKEKNRRAILALKYLRGNNYLAFYKRNTKLILFSKKEFIHYLL